MSRTPLLLRSSPALGTGSYGGVPVHLVLSDDEDYVRKPAGRLAMIKGVSKSSTHVEGPRPGAYHSKSLGSRRKRRASHVDMTDDVYNSSDVWASSSGRLRTSRSDLGHQTGSSQHHKSARRGAAARLADPTLLYHDVMTSASDTGDPDGDAESIDSSESKAERGHDDAPEDDSPYPEVRASVPPTDNFTLSINTPRMWCLSILFAVFGSSTNLFFSLRYPSVSITPVIALLIVHPLGLLWDRCFKRFDDPEGVYENGNLVTYDDDMTGGNDGASLQHMTSVDGSRSVLARKGGKLHHIRLWLGQGRWNEKEHCCVYISSNVSFGFAFATDVIVEQTKFYNQDAPLLYQILLTLSTQILGYAFAGLTRRFLVRPGGMIWPSTLVSTSMFSGLHKEENEPKDGWHISRFKFFAYIFIGSAAFYFLPGLLFPALSYFNVVTWLAPNSVIVANLFGVSSGLGMLPLTFDWSQIAYIGSPLVVPFWAAVNVIGGLVLVMWILAPILYYTNSLYSAYMPILSASVFDNTGKSYDVSRILNADFTFDRQAYEQYSPVFLPITYVLSYALQFAAMTALITHTFCWHGKDIWRQWTYSLHEIRGEEKSYQPLSTSERDPSLSPALSSLDSEPGLSRAMQVEDVHNRLMRRYQDVPMLWYLVTGISMAAIGIFVVEYFPVHLPWYGLLLALSICALLYIPIGIVMATTNQQSSMYLICQLIAGYAFPGRPIANMVFVTYGYITSTQGLKFSSDMKLGHYMKIPPKLLFTVQLVATLVASLTQIGVLNWMLASIPGICTLDAINGFTCPIARVHFNGSVLWGVVGPDKFFGPGAMYRPLVWAFLFGAIAPPIFYYLYRYLAARVKARALQERNKATSSGDTGANTSTVPSGGQQPRPWPTTLTKLLPRLNIPVLLGSISWIPPATGLNFSTWFLVCFLFNSVLKKRHPGWWGKYTMTLSAALDSGLAVGVVVVFFGIVYPGYADGLRWWGTEVFKWGCDWKGCALRDAAGTEGGKFGPERW